MYCYSDVICLYVGGDEGFVVVDDVVIVVVYCVCGEVGDV